MKKSFNKYLIGLCSLGSNLNADTIPFFKPEIGAMTYNISGGSLSDVSGNADNIKVTKASWLPFYRATLGGEYDDLKMFYSDQRTTGRIGVAVQYAQKKDGVLSDYYNAGYETAAYTGKEDIKRWDVLLQLEYDFFNRNGYMMTLGGGVGFVYGALRYLRLYQANNDAFIGQSLKPHMCNAAGDISFALRKVVPHVESLVIELGYRLGLNNVPFYTAIVQTQPDADAGWPAQNAFHLLGDLSLQKAPSQFVYAQQLSIGLQWDF